MSSLVVQNDDAWKNTIFIPFAATVASVIALVAQIITSVYFKSRRVPSDAEDNLSKPDNDETGVLPNLSCHVKRYVHSQGGVVIFSYKTGRLLGCLVLFSLSLVTLIAGEEPHEEQRFLLERSPEITLTVVYLYTSFLSAASLVHSTWSRILTRHNIFVLFSLAGVYAYRDLWPFVTYTDAPMDAAEGLILWAKIIALAITAIIIPLFIPREYVPLDPKNPMDVLNPEQTASIFSFMVYKYLDPIIFEASKVPHLSHTRLPVLTEYDRSKYITDKAFPHLDPFHGAPKRHFFFGLLRVFFREYLAMSVALVIQVVASFASPLALNRILASLETEGHDDYIQPWAWILCLFLGPVIVSISFQAYTYLGGLTLLRAQAILTELVFEHSFRIRFKAEASTNNSGDETQSIQTGSTFTKAKGKAVHTPTGTASAPETKTKKKDNLVGKINTLVTVDVDNILGARDFLILFLQVPLELVMAVTFLYVVLGWSAILGLATTVILLPVPGYLGSRLQKAEKMKLEKTDARVEAVTETVGVLRMVKLFGWENKMSNILKEKREEELAWIWKGKVINLSNHMITATIPTITMVVTFGTYTGIMRESLNASKIFSSIAVFDIIRGVLQRSAWMFSLSTKAKVSLDRMGDFLRKTELLDHFSDEKSPLIAENDVHDGVIGFNNAVFAWSEGDESGTQTPSSRFFRLRTEGELFFKRGCLNLIVGPTGSGKTSVLMALLGEMHFIPSSVDSWYNLPRGGGVAYAAQESWVQNETIRDNILFGSTYDEDRYQKVIKQCSSKHDLELFEAGDQTEVGEKGLTLSGGQKARVTLARAVYSTAEILLLDDVLAALDVHTAKAVVDDCLKGDLIRGRTVLLVTHNVALTSPIADHIVSIGLDGIAREIGNDISAALVIDPILAREVEHDVDEAEVEKEVVDTIAKEGETNGKLIIAEEIVEGRVRWRSIMLYLKGLGGDNPTYFMIIWMLGIAFTEVGRLLGSWFLGFWGSQYENQQPEDVQVSYYLTLYTLIVMSVLTIYALAAILYNYATIRASRRINVQLVDSVLGSTLRWLDETPTSRVVARCTGDIAALDGQIHQCFYIVVEIATCMTVQLAVPAIMAPIILGPGLLVAVVGVYIAKIYLKAQMSVKREMSNARAPVLAHFGAAVTGLTSIRAYGAQQFFKTESLKKIDHYTKIARTSYNLNRWLSVRVDFIGALFTTGLATYLLAQRTLSSGNVGFALKMVILFNTLILHLVRWYNEFEVQANSLERIQSYIDIEHEPKPTEAGKPPASWPKSGELRVEGLTSRYSLTGPKVLQNISFHVKSGERVGIVGRTGSGKSSLTLSLLRSILTDGEVYYDGLATNKINLDELRSNITIIPQMPELLSGSLRRNLDPFRQNDDATLNSALRAAGLFSLQSETDEARLTLESDISNGGGNLSVGQRQIIALARAIVRNSKLLILDEATSAIDHKTDSIIQSSLRNELGSDVTVLTVAHRLQTIMDADKIMVLDNGRMVEFDTPQTLLNKKGGYFKSLVDGSGDKGLLYAMAEVKSSGSTA